MRAFSFPTQTFAESGWNLIRRLIVFKMWNLRAGVGIEPVLLKKGKRRRAKIICEKLAGSNNGCSVAGWLLRQGKQSNKYRNDATSIKSDRLVQKPGCSVLHELRM